MSTIHSIYKFTNEVNGKVYIGYTSQSPQQRLSCHKSNHNNPKRNSYNYYLYNAMRKHGFENFKFEVLYQSKDGKHTLNVMESYFICVYRSFIGYEDSNGYNLTLGGQGTLGRQHSEETKNLISMIVKKDLESGKRKPYKHNEEWKTKLKTDNPGGNATAIRIYQFSSDGVLIKIHKSAMDAARSLGDVKFRGNILECTVMAHRLYKGFYWRKQDHKDSIVGIISDIEALQKKLRDGRLLRHTNKIILQYDEDMSLVAEHSSIQQAVNANKPSSTETIAARCRDGKLYKGHYWKFKEDEEV
jgi:group I intron endonuclease